MPRTRIGHDAKGIQEWKGLQLQPYVLLVGD